MGTMFGGKGMGYNTGMTIFFHSPKPEYRNIFFDGSTGPKVGGWQRFRDTARVCCPRCGNTLGLYDYAIAPDGRITNYKCPRPQFDFKDDIQLEGCATSA